jgi:CheY-like chemotaxis protein
LKPQELWASSNPVSIANLDFYRKRASERGCWFQRMAFPGINARIQRVWVLPPKAPRKNDVIMPTEPAWQRENRQPRVLIVDDDFEIAEPVKYALEGLGYTVTHVSDGNKGVDAIAVVNPELMVLDMMMPGRSGFLVLEHLRKMKRDHVRVIMVTGNEGERHQAYARMLGADDYMHKPFAMEKLVARAKELLALPFVDALENKSTNDDSGKDSGNPTELPS